jgi:hypothetical protein
VEDEFTYYAEGKPKVANATVKVQNTQTHVHFTKLTNENGIAYFDEITEGNFKLTVQKLGHGSYQSTVLVGFNTTQVVFIPRQVVSYVWTVTPTTVEDKYVFTLEAVFETHVWNK